MKTVVLYHANCPDGFCAAWAAKRVHPDAEFIPVNYGQSPPDVSNCRVFILDFSYKREVMRKILSDARAVVVLDHHKTAQAELAGIVDEFVMRPDLINPPISSELPIVHFDMQKSGGRLAWEFFHPGKIVPWLVAYTEDRDMWWHKLPNTREVAAAIRSYDFDFAVWDDIDARGMLGNCPPDSLVFEGRAILRYQQQLIELAVSNATEVELDGHKIKAVNTTVCFSEVAGELAKGRPFGAAWFVRSDGKRQWSLRSTDDGLDVSEIAKRHGGGGHRNAAGFEEPAFTAIAG